MIRVSIFLVMLITAALIAGMVSCSGGPIRIFNWYDMYRVREDLGGSYILMHDLDTTSADYSVVVIITGGDWNPIGSSDDPFTGTFDGQGHEIRNLVINRPTRDRTGLFGAVENGIIRNLRVVNATVTGHDYVGGLVGWNTGGNISACHFTGNVTGWDYVGGLVGWSKNGVFDDCHVAGNIIGQYGPDHYSNGIGGLVGYNSGGSVSNSSSSGSVTGSGQYHGGLVGWNEEGTVENCYSNSDVNGGEMVGGLIGYQSGDYYAWGSWYVAGSYFTGNVTGCCAVGGLVGRINKGVQVGNSHYDYDEVLINGRNMITIGALFDEDFEEWLANGKVLPFGDRLFFDDDGYVAINNISDLKQVLVFGQDPMLRFRLKSDLDLTSEPDFYIPYLAGEFDGDGHTVFNLSVSLDSAFGVGVFGYVGGMGKVSNMTTQNVNITAAWSAGGLVGHNEGILSNCHSTGSVSSGEEAGGLVGSNTYGIVGDSYSCCDVTGGVDVGGLVGRNEEGAVEDCYATGSASGSWDYAGGLVGWNSGTVSNSYSIGEVVGSDHVGGLVGGNDGTVSNSFWDTETSGQIASASGTGKTTAEMQDIATFSGVTWNIIAVANPGTRNPSYIWNIATGLTYPFLSWQS
jgi:hypothetical protein